MNQNQKQKNKKEFAFFSQVSDFFKEEHTQDKLINGTKFVIYTERIKDVKNCYVVSEI